MNKNGPLISIRRLSWLIVARTTTFKFYHRSTVIVWSIITFRAIRPVSLDFPRTRNFIRETYDFFFRRTRLPFPPKSRYTFFKEFFWFFSVHGDLQAFENWSRTHNRLSDRTNYVEWGSYVCARTSAAVKYWFSFADMTMIWHRRSPGLWYVQKFTGLVPCK